MKISNQGIELIKKFEGCKLTAYRDSVGIPTIGIGHTRGVKMGMKITLQQAADFLRDDLAYCEKTLNGIGVVFTQNEYDALCSWVFNLGVGSFTWSTMYKRIVARADKESITDEMVKWVYAGGRSLLGLKRRRVEEANMYLGRALYYIDANNNIRKRDE